MSRKPPATRSEFKVWRKMTTRYAFRGPQGPEIADELLATLGGSKIVHGHSVIADQLGVPPEQVVLPFAYRKPVVGLIDVVCELPYPQ